MLEFVSRIFYTNNFLLLYIWYVQYKKILMCALKNVLDSLFVYATHNFGPNQVNENTSFIFEMYIANFVRNLYRILGSQEKNCDLRFHAR